MEQRRLGRTEHRSSVAVLGAAAFARCTLAEAEAGFELALSRGVNHVDIAPTYGYAEVVVGAQIAAARDRLFVAGKSDRSNPAGVRAHLERTLTRLGTDRLDLYQLHGVTSLDVLEQRSAAAEVVLAARDEGLTRFVGITGHDLGTPRAQLEALRRYDLDTVMFPIYPRVWADPVYRTDAEALLAECAASDVGVMVIKAAARRPWGDQDPTRSTWYEPQTDPDAIARGIAFALSTDGVHAFCTPGDLGLLPTVLDVAEANRALDDGRDDAMAATAHEELIFPLQDKFRRR
jgi:aryl-alcohol dehydrogenase-like predicted oxidoreductase